MQVGAPLGQEARWPRGSDVRTACQLPLLPVRPQVLPAGGGVRCGKGCCLQRRALLDTAYKLVSSVPKKVTLSGHVVGAGKGTHMVRNESKSENRNGKPATTAATAMYALCHRRRLSIFLFSN